MDRRLTNRRQGRAPGISMSGTALKWTGFLFVYLGSFSAAVIQRGVMGFGPDASAETMYQAMSPRGRPLDFNVQNPVWALGLGAIMVAICRMWKAESGAGGVVFRSVVVAAAVLWALLLRVHMGATLLGLDSG